MNTSSIKLTKEQKDDISWKFRTCKIKHGKVVCSGKYYFLYKAKIYYYDLYSSYTQYIGVSKCGEYGCAGDTIKEVKETLDKLILGTYKNDNS